MPRPAVSFLNNFQREPLHMLRFKDSSIFCTMRWIEHYIDLLLVNFGVDT